VAGQLTSPILVDPGMTVGAGASVTATIAEAVAHAENALVPVRVLGEERPLSRSANIAYRWLKLVYFDLPQERWFVVVNHELFGHGGRLRERFSGPIQYRIEAPFPYGHGGGSTSFALNREPTTYELMSASVAGMEADAVSARLVAHSAFVEQRMRPRDAMRYLGFELDTFGYVLGTGDEPEEPGHDVSDFLALYNGLAMQQGTARLEARTLRREALIALANPVVVHALYAIGRHVWDGAEGIRVRAISIAGVRYLPIFRYQLTPYGTEWSVTNELAGRIRPTQIEVRVGRSAGARPWGLGVRQYELVRWGNWGLDLGVEVWAQPPVAERTPTMVTADLQLGGEVGGRAERPLPRLWFNRAASFIVDVRVKTAGFVPGEPLGRGAVMRAGVGIPLR
jgi:hypothetical protein